jgi:hypothetical protein
MASTDARVGRLPTWVVVMRVVFMPRCFEVRIRESYRRRMR